MKRLLKEYGLPIAVVAASTVVIAAYYPHLPARIPTHWNFSGQADQYNPKWPFAFMGTGISVIVLAMFALLPRLDPMKANYGRFGRTYRILRDVVVSYTSIIGLIPVASATGLIHETGPVIMVGVGLLLATIGNYMGQLKRNWYAGIRTPWTLSNETVWNKTHRLGGKLWVVAGLIDMVAGFIPKPIGPIVFAVATLLGGVVPIVYSYIIFREETHSTKPPKA